MSKEKDSDVALQLTAEEISKIADHFNRSNPDDIRSCHICGETTWHPLPSIYTPVIFDRKSNHHRRDRLVPMVIVCCANCGASTMFLADKIGIKHRIFDDEGDD